MLSIKSGRNVHIQLVPIASIKDGVNQVVMRGDYLKILLAIRS